MPDQNYQGRENRKHFRLIFPAERMPRIKISNTAYAIIDMSQIGIRFYNPFNHRMPDDQFTAFVAFKGGEQVKVNARVVRFEPLMVALFLVEGIPAERMLAEQALLNQIPKN